MELDFNLFFFFGNIFISSTSHYWSNLHLTSPWLPTFKRSITYLRECSGTRLISSLPVEASSLAHHSTLPWAKLSHLNVDKLHNWPSCFTSYHPDRSHRFLFSWTQTWAAAPDLQQWVVLLGCLTLIKLIQPPLAWQA